MSGQWSTREREHAALLNEEPSYSVENLRQSAPLSTAAENVSVSRTRDRDNAIEFQNQQTDPTTPEGRKAAWNRSVAEENERLNKLGAEARAKNERIRQEAERVRKARELDAQRDREARNQFTAKVIANSLRSTITAFIRQYDLYDRLPELQTLVKSYGLGLQSVEAWETACKTLAKK